MPDPKASPSLGHLQAGEPFQPLTTPHRAQQSFPAANKTSQLLEVLDGKLDLDLGIKLAKGMKKKKNISHPSTHLWQNL